MIWKTALGLVASAVVRDAVVRPRQAASLARGYCDRVGKPLLNLSAGARTVQGLITGAPCWGDVNIAPDAPVNAPSADEYVYGDPYDLSIYADGHFGAVLAVGVLERLRRPDAALIEWRRVATKVFVVVPAWYSPLTWLDPSHRWYITQDLSRAWPTIWTNQERVYLLPAPMLSDNIPRRWIPETNETTNRSSSAQSPSPPQQTPSSKPQSQIQGSSRTTPGASASSSSVSALTVLSGPDDSESSSPSRSTVARSRSGT